MDRRKFLRNGGLAATTAMLSPWAVADIKFRKRMRVASSKDQVWLQVRDQFGLRHDHIQMAQMLLASHPDPVREAIDRHQQAFNENPATYWEEHGFTKELEVCKAAAAYMDVHPDEIALTDSTTQGLAILYNGFRLQEGDEVISTTHDHYVTDMSLKYACKRKGATIKTIAEYDDPALITEAEVVENIINAITPKTRLIAVTWVHSCTGVKLPIKAIATALAEVNQKRSQADRIYFSVDGVHGFGNQDESISELGCDFFVAGTHKWIFGPRGTGLLWARKEVWDMVEPTIPAFSMPPFMEWMEVPNEQEPTFRELMSPGGFHAFDHRWALQEAFEFQMKLGRDKVHQRTTFLNTMLKEGIKDMPHVHLHTPVDPRFSAGINCFEIQGMTETEAVTRFHELGIIASSSPYKVSYARLTPCIINTEEEVQLCLKALEKMKV